MAEKNPIPKAQHIVPRLHLQHFSGPEPKGQVWTYDKNTGNTRSAIPEETATYGHFYSLEREDGTQDTTIERALADNEGKSDPIYKKLLAGYCNIEGDERAEFSVFLATLYLRTKAMRQDAANVFGMSYQNLRYAYGSNDEAFNELINRVEKAKNEKIPDNIKAIVRRSLIDPSQHKVLVSKVPTITVFDSAAPLAQIFYDMNWSIVNVKHGFLITSDNPVVKVVDPATRHPIYGDGGFINR